MTKPKDAGDSLSAIMNTLAEQAAGASDKELLDEAVSEGIDAKSVAAHVRGLLLDAVLRTKKERLRKAAEGYGLAVADLAARTARLPNTAEGRRALLDRVLQSKPEMRSAVVTLQHRNFESFSDTDVESALKQLDALGLLDEETDPKP
jgi:hypothetical protein